MGNIEMNGIRPARDDYDKALINIFQIGSAF